MICINCNSTQTYRNQWYRYQDGYVCKKCRNKLIDSPKWNKILNTKWNPINHRIHNPRRMWFKDKSVHLKENPRTGVCQQCGRNDIRTHIHHEQYDESDPLKHTIELCASCHKKRSVELGQLKW